MRTLPRLVLAAAGLMLALGSVSASGLVAQEVRVPPTLQYPLLAKIMQYDRNFAERSDGEFVLALLYQEELPESQRLRDDFLEVAEESPISAIGGVPIRVESFRLGDGTGLAEALREARVDAVYLPPLRARSPEDVCTAVEEAGAICLTGVEEYVGRGAAVGIGDENGRPVILIDLGASRAQGADFSSQLLRLARVVGGRP